MNVTQQHMFACGAAIVGGVLAPVVVPGAIAVQRNFRIGVAFSLVRSSMKGLESIQFVAGFVSQRLATSSGRGPGESLHDDGMARICVDIHETTA